MTRRIITLAASAATVLASTLALSSANAAEPDPTTPYAYGASAGGTLVQVLGSTTSSSPTSASAIQGTTYPAGNSNSTADVKVGTVVVAGGVATSTSATKVGTNIKSTATAETANASLLNGLIKVNAIKTVTHADRNGTVLSGDSDTEFAGVTINGKKIALNVDNNFGVNIAGVASVILNEKKVDIVGGRVTVTGSALKVTLLKKYEGDPIGTTIALNPTTTTLAPSEHPSVQVGGYAYGSYVALNVGSSVHIISGPSAAIASPPGGTFGYDIFNKTVGIKVPLVIQGGVVQSRANSVSDTNTADVTHENSITDLNVLNGLIKADVIKVTSRSQKLGVGNRIQTPSAELVGLVIGGKKIALNVAPNTAITLPGVLKVVINEQTVNSLGNQVAGLHVTLLSPRSGLKAGADIYIAVAGSITY
jgi:hypothetical protein